MKKNYYYILILFSFLISSCAGGWTVMTPVNEGQVIETKGYKIRVPNGDGWTVRVNYSQGSIVLQKANPHGNTTFISVLRGWINQALAETPSDLQISYVILNGELKNMISRGQNKYDVEGEFKTFLSVGDKRLHGMSYEIWDYSQQVEKHIDYKMFIYLPPNFRSRRIYYTFLIGEPFGIGNTEYKTDLTIIDFVIKSFKEKNNTGG